MSCELVRKTVSRSVDIVNLDAFAAGPGALLAAELAEMRRQLPEGSTLTLRLEYIGTED